MLKPEFIFQGLGAMLRNGMVLGTHFAQPFGWSLFVAHKNPEVGCTWAIFVKEINSEFAYNQKKVKIPMIILENILFHRFYGYLSKQ